MTNQHPRSATTRRAARLLLPLLIGACFSGAGAAPVSPQVVAGQATFSQQGNVFSITNTPNTVINWQSFSVNAGDITRFVQQSGDSAVLNRIVGQDPSRILGALQSNGHVFLINPNGIMFGKDSRVDVNGLTASTLNMSNADFLAGKNSFMGGKQAGAIVNHGKITTPSGGQVFLIAPDVNNAGIITSPQGQVVLAAGHTVQLADSSNPGLQVVVSAPSDRAINLGQIIAQGGRVGIYGALVSQRGVVNADSAQVGANGKIVLRASGDAMLEAGSVTSATGAGKGGQVTVEGRRVGMLGDARIDASGATGGGSVLLGGGFQGKDAQMSNAQQTLMGRHASIRADATGSGNGGTVVLWGDASTRALGTISAQGGARGGDGGLVETSGKHLDVDGIKVSAGAANGVNGTWLLDPTNIEVTTSGTALLGDVDQFADPGATTQIHPGTIGSVSPGTNVVLQATNNVVINAGINPPLTTGSLKIEAGNNIDINAPVSTTGGAISLSANHTSYASGSGAVNSSAAGFIATGGGDLNLKGYAVNLAGPVSTSGGNIFANASSLVRVAGNVNTSGGVFKALANNVQVDGSGTALNTGGGNIELTSAGGVLTLGSTSTLASGGFIDLFTNSASLLGNIDGAGGPRPIVSFSPFSPGWGITVSMTAAGGSLVLDPNKLAMFNVQGIILGNTSMTGNIDWLDAYTGGVAKTITFNTQGNINIADSITLPAGSGSALLFDLDGASTSSVTVGAAIAADSITVQADNMHVNAPVTGSGASGAITLVPHQIASAINLGAAAADAPGTLALSNTELAFLSAPTLAIGGAIGQSGALNIVAGGASFAGMGAGSLLKVSAGEANLTLNGNLQTAGTLYLQGNDLQTTSTSVAKAGSIFFASTFGVGSGATPFNTETSKLSAANNRVGGLSPISIVNTGNAVLGSIHQNGSGNEGPISIINNGSLALPDGESVVTGGSGGVLLKSTSGGLTIDGDISTQGGGIGLEAGGGGVLTIGATAQVVSMAGNIGLTAGSVLNNGSISTGSGNIGVSAASVTGSGTFAAPGGVVTGATPTPPATPTPTPTPAPPTVSECVANSTLAGCGAILQTALDGCIVNPAGPDCAIVLPTLQTCIATPTAAGCGVVLPTLTSCVATPAAPGCSVVLPTVNACIATPAAPGCSVVLPTLPACIATPGMPGCVVVLPTLPVCEANPAAAGCSVVLPTLSACVANPGMPGCAAVLPTLTSCLANPAAPGCSVVLPTLAQCIASPLTSGCAVVLPTLAQCIGNPSTPGCLVVLPTLAQCIANPGAAGCGVVLPTLSQCTATPTLAGCAVVLPTLAQCTASPTLQGCSVVLPPLSACVANPAAPGCQVVAPPSNVPPGGSLEQALNNTVAVVNATTGTLLPNDSKKLDKDGAGSKDAPAVNLPGEKSDIRKKTYCN